MAFTVKFLDSLQPKDKPYRVFEGRTHPGFGVQVSSGGGVAFIYLYRNPETDKQRIMKLGAYYGVGRDGAAQKGGLNLKDAHAAYAEARKIRESGHDPQTVKAEQLVIEQAKQREAEASRKQEAMNGSIRQMLEAYTDDLKARGKRSHKEAKGLFEHNVYGVIVGATKAKDVTPGDIKQVLAEIIKRGSLVTANRARAYLSAAFTFGIQWDNDPNRMFEPLRFGIQSHPVRDVPKPMRREAPRERALSEGEVRQLWGALDHSGLHEKTIAAIRLLFALGGQRVEDVLGLCVDDVDMQNRIVTCRDTKNGSTHIVPFGDVAAPILQAVLGQSKGGQLFGKVKAILADKADEPISSSTISHATSSISQANGMEHFQPRDIRRTVKTLMGFAGIAKAERDRFQNHALTDVSSKHYDRYDYLAEKRHTMAVWDNYLKAVIAGDTSSKVVPIRAMA